MSIKAIIGVCVALAVWSLALWKMWDIGHEKIVTRQVQTIDIPLPGPAVVPAATEPPPVTAPAAPSVADVKPAATAPRQARPKAVAKAKGRPVIRVVRKQDAPAALPALSSRLFGEAPTSVRTDGGQ